MNYWEHRTNTGRVVYQRKIHRISITDVSRLFSGWIKRQGGPTSDREPRGGEKYWAAINHLCDVSTSIVVDQMPEGERAARPLNDKLQPIVTPEHWNLARLIYYIEQVKWAAGFVLNNIPIVKDVWGIGERVLDAALNFAKERMGPYTYKNNPESLTLF